MEVISFQEGFDHCSSFLLLLYQIIISLETLNNTNVLSLSYCQSEVQYESHWAKIKCFIVEALRKNPGHSGC